ncbi:ATP/GTP-binding site motif A (P-loop) [Methanococcus vannielii SB]|uniref:ATP/GTP-binding site motif A (P-loop) n=1 Tax=Methanococcus vannielii (strain ATCC 35089 / DSM 1224 / JCM 13029 / OCM 148 / SB) TaxID=406327 RepID=A6USI6_METVS|nr:hypothetical protein [Methanococcus vannielii]ABR55458.1 ATP/GTP-binding site motif A (P-loop) [Methanococcus vannielii SB]
MSERNNDEEIEKNILKHLYKINSRDSDAFLSLEVFKTEFNLEGGELYRNIDSLFEKKLILKGKNPEVKGYNIKLSQKGIEFFENPVFIREEIEKAYRTFKIYSDEVSNASYENYSKSLSDFLNYCKKNEVLDMVIFRLCNAERDFEKWYDSLLNSKVHSNALPLDEDEKISILYRFLNEINSGKIKISEFVNSEYKISGKAEEIIKKFNQSIFSHFVRGIDLKLKKMMIKVEKLQNSEDLTSEISKKSIKVRKIDFIDSDSFVSKKRLENFEKSPKKELLQTEVIDGDALSRKLSKNNSSLNLLEQGLLNIAEELRNDKKPVEAISYVYLLSKKVDSSNVLEIQELLREAILIEPSLKDKFKELAMSSSIEIANTEIIKGILSII